MPLYLIDPDSRIRTATSKRPSRPARKELQFSTEDELETLAISWPGRRFVEIWNKLPGARRVIKFTDRKTAIRRIWKALSALSIPDSRSAATTARSGIKRQLIIALLHRAAGATLKELISATGWQSHSIRGFISGQLKKKGLRIQSFKRSGERVYRIHPGLSRISPKT